MTPEQIETLARELVDDTRSAIERDPEGHWHACKAHEVCVYHYSDGSEPWAVASLWSYRPDPVTLPLYDAVCRLLEARDDDA